MNKINDISRRKAIKILGLSGLALGLPYKGFGRSLSEITEITASVLSVMIRTKKVSCEEVMQAYLTKIATYNPLYNAIVSMPNEEILIEQARNADLELSRGKYRGWMHGMPHAIKDLAYSNDLPTSEGSPIIAGFVAKKDDLFVSRIRAAGAIFIGKTNAPEFGYGSQTYNNVFGTTRNAYDSSLTAGGSSGGAAVGLATHMLPVADGSDMMGSLRNPAAFNNVIGFRPSQGRVPSYFSNSDSFYQQLSTDGAMGRNVEDTMRLLSVIAGSDKRLPLSLTNRLPKYEELTPAVLRDIKIGWMGDYDGYLPIEKGLLRLCEYALEDLGHVGLVTEPCSPRYDMNRLWQTWLTLRHWSCFWAKEYYEDLETRKLLKPELIWEIEGAFKITSFQLHQAGIARTSWYESLLELLEKYDFLALPSAQVFPFSADLHWPKSINGVQMDTYHRWMEVVIGGTLAGLPVINLPVGFDTQGRPMGIQFIGRMGEDAKLIEFAMAYEANTDYLNIRPVLQLSS
jgi:amidase